MANDTRSSRKIKDDENSISKERHNSGKGVTSSSTESPDTSGLRRSSRETSSLKKNLTQETSYLKRNKTLETMSSKKNMTLETTSLKKDITPSSSSTRKSERLEKKASTTSPVQKKSERFEKQAVMNSLRRSERGKKPSSPSSSGSKKSDRSVGSSEMIPKKEKKEKSVKQLTMETKEVSNRSEKQYAEHVQVVKRRMDARAYREIFKRSKKVKAIDHNKELNCIDKSSQEDSCNAKEDTSKQVNGITEGSKRRLENLREKDVASTCEVTLEGPNAEVNESAKETFEAGDIIEVSKSDVMAREIGNDAEQAQIDCFAKENFQSPEHKAEEGTLDADGQNVTPLKRKRNEDDMVSDASAVIASKDTCVSPVDVVTSSPTKCDEMCDTCLMRQRVDSDSTKQELCPCFPNSKEKLDGDLCDAYIATDRGELQAGITRGLAAQCKNHKQQNGFYEDIPACEDQSTCLICKLGGKLLFCDGKGCKRSYHLSCLDHSPKDVSLGAWHCIMCVKKKLESGVHSLSEGVESIWDAREVEVSEDGELRRQKQYFVKYKGLAHAHNRWVPESHLLSEVPLLVAKFNRKNEVARWKQEWTLPHRLLLKRSLIFPKQHYGYFREHAGEDSDCHYEWLVKWRGLGYEHATWELENACFINSPEGQSLIRDYENRHRRAKQASLSSVQKAQKLKKGFPVKLPHLHAGDLFGFDNNLDFVNKLREYWHKGQNAIVNDDQERIVKVTLFILSLLSDVSRPFLIISTSNMLHLWEVTFSRIAPSTDVVVYDGNIEIRKQIRTLEFYEEGGCIMFQVLITSPEVVIEDLNVFKTIGWEAIVIDGCQRSKISSHFEQIKMLATDMRLLLVGGQLKDSIIEYRNILSLLESHGGLDRSDDLMEDANENIGILREKLSKYVAYGGKLESSRFMEYWVPVHISNVQLEQYCATLLSKSLLLSSPLKNDPVGALREVLFSTRKCCDHPYLVDQSLQSLLIKDLKETEYLDVGIKASGKLQLLDRMLSEMKNQGLRVLILFQSIGGGRESISIGDILDDFVRQRFGPDSYERIDGHVIPSKKQAALHNFNKEIGRFVFLLETRACLPSIKLSSVDTVIIFHSDWTPLNDLRALQRITLDSKFEQIKIFRLYSSFTVEERVLFLAKQDKTPDGYVQSMRPGTSQLMLMWGASYLFNRLDEFHGGHNPVSSSSSFLEQSLLKDVAQEFLTILSQTGEDNDTSKFNIILKVKQNQGTYNTSFPLFGESKIERMEEGLPHIFWAKLFEGKHPCWKYSSGSSQRSRKRVQYFDNLQKKPEAENDEVVKKHRKTANSSVNPFFLKPGVGGKIVLRDNEGTSARSDAIQLKDTSASPLGNNISKISGELSYSQKSLHLLLKPEIAKLCEVLQLREDVMDMVEKFLEYVMINHRVQREPLTILQAFEISLCWTAASLQKQKIDHKESFALAKRHLNFGCKKEEADNVYSRLQCLKDVFLYKMEKLKAAHYPKASELSMKDVIKDQSNACLSESETSKMPKVQAEYWSIGLQCSDEPELFQVAQKDFSRSIRRIKKKCDKQMAKLCQKHQEEKEDINKRHEKAKAELENNKKTEAAIIRLYTKDKMQTDKLKNLDNQYARQLEELKHKRDMDLKNLDALHVASMNKVREREASWVEGVKSWLLDELLHKPPSNELGHGVQCLQTVEQQKAHDNQETVVRTCSHISEGQNPNKSADFAPMSEEGVVESYRVLETVPDEAVAGSNPLDTAALPIRPGTQGDKLDTIAPEKTLTALLKGNIEASNSGDNQENVVSLSTCAREQILDGATLCMPDGQCQTEFSENISSSDSAEEGLLPVHSSDGQILDAVRLKPQGEVPGPVTRTVSSNDDLENVVPVNAPSFKEQSTDGEFLLRVPEAASSSNCTNNILDSPSKGQIATGAQLAVPDGEVPLRVPENTSFTDVQENVVSLDPSSRKEILEVAISCSLGSEALLGVPESSPDGIVEGCDINREDNEAHTMISDNVNRDLHLHEQSLVNPPSVQTQTTVALDSPFSSNQVLQDVCSELTTSTGVQDGDTAASEIQVVSQVEPPLFHPADFVASNQSSQGAAAREPVVVENHVELSNQVHSQPLTSSMLNPPIDTTADGFRANTLDARTAAITSGYSNHTAQNAAPVASRLPPHMFQDPLQNELERLQKSTEEAIKIHEETKLQLKSNCDREIEEAVTQIRRKYELKLQEMEAEFVIRKNELDANQNKVWMNRILAEAFRFKCMDTKVSTGWVQQEVSSSSIQQLAQLLSQHTAQRPSISVSPSSSGPPATPAASLQNASPTVPPLQAGHNSSVLSSSIPSRPPHIGSLVSPAGSHQNSSGIRAPAPHLQPFRPSTSFASTSLPSSGLLPSQQIPSSIVATSLSLAQRPHLPPLPTYNSDTLVRANRPGASLHSTSMSALDLLMDIDNRFGTNQNLPSNLPLQSDFGSSLGPHVQPESSLQSTRGSDPIQMSEATNVVCLSDDD